MHTMNKINSNFRNALKVSTVEKDVENAYRASLTNVVGLSSCLKEIEWTSPYSTDGYATWTSQKGVEVRLVAELKHDIDLRNRVSACTVLGQSLLYMKRWEMQGQRLPNVLLVGDMNECFVLPTDAVKGYLSLSIDWSVAPSKGSPELTRALVSSLNILPFVHTIDNTFKISQLVNLIEMHAEGSRPTVRASEKNLDLLFRHWSCTVLKKADEQFSPSQKADIFLRCLFSPEDVYLHPKQKNTLVVPGYTDPIFVDAEAYKSYFSHFEQGYRPSEIIQFMSIKDRMIDDDYRRRQGAFFTPAIWANEAILEIERVLGTNWRKECVVWDPAAGTGNLTRDHEWGQLYSSTFEQSDVDVMQEHGWGGRVFRMDFLNDDPIPPDVDDGLKRAASEGKRLVWFMNPPYAEHSTAGTSGQAKTGVAKNFVNTAMLEEKLGLPSRQLYAQFMFQCRKVAEQYGFKDYTVALFSVPTFMNSGSYRSLRDWWYGAHEYRGGFMFQASNFADVSGRWGVSFTIWYSGGKTDTRAEQPIRLCDERDFAVVTDGIKQVYTADGREASEWVRAPVKGLKGVDAPQMTSGLKFNAEGNKKFVPGGLFNMNNDSNALMKSATDVFFTSVCSTRNAGVSVLPTNWRRAVALYSARKLVEENWVNQKDEYLVPDETPGYDQWMNDCHVYALLHNANNCTAMRDVLYKGKTWQIHNHWFWMTHDTVHRAVDTRHTHALFKDARTHKNEPYFAKLLAEGLVLSDDAAEIINKLNVLWIKSLECRETYYASRDVTEDQPDLHLTAWDAGIYQLKHLWREMFTTEWAEIQALFRNLANRLRSGVYHYGFLRA